MKKQYTAPDVQVLGYEPCTTIANGSTLDGEFNLGELYPGMGI